MAEIPAILFDSFGSSNFASSWRFNGYVKTVVATHTDEVRAVLNQVERASIEGLYAVGFVAYEAAAALNPDLSSLPSFEGLPLAWFALFRERSTVPAGSTTSDCSNDVVLTPLNNFEKYSGHIDRIRDYIAAGDCYQVNYTFPLQGDFKGAPRGFYNRICAAQQAPFCAYLDMGRFTILSASPELFFELKERVITTRPMKGTASRGRWSGEDLHAIEQLRNSPKERAENLMIVDLLRNDLGVVAETGSVTVERMFEVETYPTVHQMTSTVSARLRPEAGLVDIFQALFPCGSVTGAPKRRSMEIVTELEGTPRGVYCGAIGCVAPGGEALFSVAIRTLLLDTHTHSLSMGVGSAITWDSDASSEYAESLHKGLFVNRQTAPFQLIESLRLEDDIYTLLDRHVDRLAASAVYFGFTCDLNMVRQILIEHAAQATGLRKVRLTLAVDGLLDISSEPLIAGNGPLRVAVSTIRVNSNDRMRYHKTTDRGLLDAARVRRPDCDEVLLCNEHGQLTEGSYHTLVVKQAGCLVTPPLACGLLPGVMREELLERGEISEQILYPEDLHRAGEVWLINSVRGWRSCLVL